jgi:hypothetical protein
MKQGLNEGSWTWPQHSSGTVSGLRGGETIEWKNGFGETTLMKAAAGGHEDIVRLWLDDNAGVNEYDNNRETALFCATARLEVL